MECGQGLIDLLLGAVDLIEDLVSKVDAESNKVTPVDTSVMVQMLRGHRGRRCRSHSGIGRNRQGKQRERRRVRCGSPEGRACACGTLGRL